MDYEESDIDLSEGNFITKLASLSADIVFSSTFFLENVVQYDNVSHGLGINSILRWIPRAGREMVMVISREFIDYSRNYRFQSVTGDLMFKFGYTFRF